MKKIFIASLLALVVSGCATTEIKKTPLISLIGGETGRIYYESSNPYGYNHILDGTDNDGKVTVFGVLKIPKGTKGKVPAIVFVHGSSGWRPIHERWLNAFNKMGIATFRLSCFSPRGISSTVGHQSRVTTATMISDAYNALKLLSTHPRIDKDRIGIMGGSKGGVVSLVSAWEPVRQSIVSADLKFALHIALYPYCSKFEKVQMAGAPILILVGEKDDWTGAEPCIECAKDLKDAGYDANIIVYPNAYHGFDSTYDVRYLSDGFNLTKCRFIVKSNGLLIETTSGLPVDNPKMLKKALAACATQGVTVGYNPSAKKKSMEDVKDFVTKIFGP